MANNTGKVVGARLPMPDYLDIVKKAADLNMNISNYVILRLYAPVDPSAGPLLQARQRVEQLTAQVESLKATTTDLTQQAQTWQQAATRQQEQQETVRLNQVVAQERADQQRAQIDTLTQQLAIEKSDRLAAQDRLVDLRKALADVHNDSGILGGMGDKYWEVVDGFVPPKP